jgi:divinyl protochlorophyllide a 8-vinyl-reductase
MSSHTTAQTTAVVACIGPNAIIQTVRALREQYGDRADTMLIRAGRPDLCAQLPAEMIDEREFQALIQRLRDQLGLEATAAILARAGAYTGDYILANRIPRPVQLILKFLPPRLALTMLLAAIAKHAWTFVGSGQFSYYRDRTMHLKIVNCVESRDVQAATPICAFYQGAFERLIRALVKSRSCVYEVACAACGDPACIFEVRGC